MAKFFDYEILANRFVLKLELYKNSSAIFPIDMLLMVMRFKEIVWHLGQHPHLNTIRDELFLMKQNIHETQLLPWF